MSNVIYIILNLCVRLYSYARENDVLCPESSLPCTETVELLAWHSSGESKSKKLEAAQQPKLRKKFPGVS